MTARKIGLCSCIPIYCGLFVFLCQCILYIIKSVIVWCCGLGVPATASACVDPLPVRVHEVLMTFYIA